MQRGRSSLRRWSAVPAAIAVVLLIGGDAGTAAVSRPRGAPRPVPQTGMGTAAAMDDPRCNTGPEFGAYGNWNTTSIGGGGSGPVCVKPWPDGADNGGATSRGVTRDTIVVAAIIPSDEQTEKLLADATQAPGVPVDRATGGQGSWEDAVHDHMLPLLEFYETWGRDIEVRFFRSTGSDETAQRADAVAIKALRPFAAVDLLSAGLLTLEAELASAGIVTFGTATTTEQALAQAPYRWGSSDGGANAVNAAAVLGRQLAGKKATFAGDALQGQARRFGAVAADIVDLDQFERDLMKEGDASLAIAQAYRNEGGLAGNPVEAQAAAPVIIQKMKDAGVTTIAVFADNAMMRALMAAATTQDYYPEWFNTGVLYSDLTLFARTYPPEQSRHLFGMTWLWPWLAPEPDPAPPAKSLTTSTDPENWYWGEGRGTASPVAIAPLVNWLLAGIHNAGPRLTPKTFERGFFSVPAYGGAATGNPLVPLTAYGRQAGLPYPAYMYGGTDFVPFWFDPDTTGIASVTGTEGKGVAWYPDEGKRYTRDTITKRPFAYFDESRSITSFERRPSTAPEPVYAGDCTTCPSATGNGQPGSPSDDGFVARADGAPSVGL